MADGDCDDHNNPFTKFTSADNLTGQGWFNHSWRPAAAWLFLMICFSDFLAAPVVNALLVYYLHIPYNPWTPLTLQGGGVFYIAFGSIIGINAWTRGQADTENVRNMPDYSNVPALQAQAAALVPPPVTMNMPAPNAGRRL